MQIYIFPPHGIVLNNHMFSGEGNTLTFPDHHFQVIADLKILLQSLENEFKQLIGEIRIIAAL